MIRLTPSLKLNYHRLTHIPLKLPITWSELGLWLIIVQGSFLGLFKRYAPVPDSLVTISYDALCFGMLLYVIIRRLLRSRRIPYSQATLPIFVFIMFVMLTVLNPVLTSYGRGLLGWRFLASSILLHFLGFYAFDNEQQVWRLLRVFWVTAVLVCLFGFLQLRRGYTAVELAWIEELAATMKIAGTNNYRLMSTMGSAVDLGFFLALAITTILGPLLFRWRQHWPYLIYLTLFCVALLFTYVRAAWAATLGGCLFLLALFVWRDKRLRLLYPSLLTLTLILLLLFPVILRTATPYVKNPALQLRLLSLADPLDDKSMQDRLLRWNEIWQVIAAYPQGIGAGMTGAASLRYANEPSPAPITPDNTYLRVLLETGWIGLLLFLWLLLSIFFRGLVLSHKLQGRLKLIARCLTSAYIAFMIILFFGEYIELNPGRTLIWIFTGLLFSLPRLQATIPSATLPDDVI